VLELATPEGKNCSIESLVIIATKKEYTLLGNFDEDPDYAIQYVGDLEKLFEWKLSIPHDEIVEKELNLTIFK